MVEFRFFSGLFFCPLHKLFLITGEQLEKIIEFAKFFVNAGGSFAVFFAVGLIDIYIFVVCLASNIYIHETPFSFIIPQQVQTSTEKFEKFDKKESQNGSTMRFVVMLLIRKCQRPESVHPKDLRSNKTQILRSYPSVCNATI